MATWSKKTYKEVARILKLHLDNYELGEKTTVRNIAFEFGATFGLDNPRFDRDRFYKAIFGEEAAK